MQCYFQDVPLFNLLDQSFHFSSGLPKTIGSCFPNLIIRADSTSYYIRIKIIVMKFSKTAAYVLVIWGLIVLH